MSNLQRQVLSKGIGMPPLPSMPATLPSASKRLIGRRDYSPLSWKEFFDEKISIPVVDGSTFNAYRKGLEGPLFLLLHGGGYSGLTWACTVRELFNIIHCQILALDLRGHGDTRTSNDADLSAATQAADIGAVLDSIYANDPVGAPPVIMIGHSMGGAIAVHAACSGQVPTLIGLIVIDVVEGSAMEALQSMQAFLLGRPKTFQTMEQAIEWCLRSGQVRNLESARVSMPAQITVMHADLGMGVSVSDEPGDVIAEEGEDAFKTPIAPRYTWRIDLSKTDPFWTGWFKGLSNMFLSVPVSKLLLLAGVDRLDRDLTIGQMQGKFQMIVLPKVGHAVHEDSPTKVAEALATFSVRNKFAEAKGEFQPVFPGC